MKRSGMRGGRAKRDTDCASLNRGYWLKDEEIVMARTLNGFGSAYYGRRPLPDGSYITTKWFVFLFVPIFPVGSERVIEASAPYGMTGAWGQSLKVQKVPLDIGLVIRLYAWMTVIIIALVLWAKFFDWMQW